MVIRKQLLRCVIGLFIIAWAIPAHPLPIISVVPEVVSGWEVDTPEPIPDFDPTVNQPGPVAVRINLFMEIWNLDRTADPPQLGFSNVAFHINFDGLQLATPPYPQDFSQNNAVVDHDGDGGMNTPPVPIFEHVSCDCGELPEPLRDILVQGSTSHFGPEGVDPRRRLGQDGPVLLGTAFLLWDGTGPASVTTELGNPIGSYYDDQGNSYALPPSQGIVGTVRLGQIPEPAALALLSMGAAILLGTRRRKQHRSGY